MIKDSFSIELRNGELCSMLASDMVGKSQGIPITFLFFLKKEEKER